MYVSRSGDREDGGSVCARRVAQTGRGAGNGGRGKPLPYGRGRGGGRGRGTPHPPQCAHWGTFPSRGRQAGRRGRRPLRGRTYRGGETDSGPSGTPAPTGADVPGGRNRQRAVGDAGPYGGGRAGVRNRQRDVGDAGPYGGRNHSPGAKPRAADSRPYGRVTIARVRNRGRLIAAPTGAGVPGCASVGGPSGTPAPTGADVPGCEVGGHLIRPSVRTGAPSPQGEGKRAVGDAGPYGRVTIARVRSPREGQAPPLRGRTNAGAGTGDTSSAPVCALGHLPLKGKASGPSRTPAPTGTDVPGVRNRGRGKPLPYGDGRAGVRVRQRAVGDAGPCGDGRTGVRVRQRAVGDAGPYGGRQEVLRQARSPARPPESSSQTPTGGCAPSATAPTGYTRSHQAALPKSSSQSCGSSSA